MVKYPQALKIHKKTAELQFNLKKPEDTQEAERTRTKMGCIFLDIAKPKGDGTDKMDWANKITMKLDTRDIAQIVLGIRTGGKANIYHTVERDDGKSATTLLVEPGDGTSYKWLVSKTVGADKKTVTVFLDQYDMYLAFNMLEAAVPLLHGWTE